MSFNSAGVLQPSGLVEEAFLLSSKLCSSLQFSIRWANAELRISELLSLIQPNGLSELRRKAVADYVSGLIQRRFGCQVFKFGSVPLKTYLPDGDIDLTVFSHHRELTDTWASDVQTVLEHEEHRKDAGCRVSKVQCIHAEVKIVKCVVEDIVVDISFNQLGGLCTLCFLEEVDRFVQKDHLFKRSILLVKAWCYYESRILGAHHGLISTYALETLVLYIFNVFHSNLRGPLEVLFTFLDYFSKFNWERYCVSLWGPVPLSSLPDLTVEPPLKGGGKLLLSADFMETCHALYGVCPNGQDTQARAFSGKFFNIVDPLRTNNNLGRSVSQANFYRIRNAFHRGACKLAEVFEVIDADVPKHLDEFFSNTWERHQSRHCPDAPTSNFPPQQSFVYNAGILDTLHSSDQANDPSGILQLEKWMVPSGEKIIMDNKALHSHPQSSIITRDISTEYVGQKLDLNICSRSFNSFKGYLESDVVDKNQTLSCPGGEINNLISGVGKATKVRPNAQSISICRMPFSVSTISHLKTRTISSASSLPSKQRPEIPAALKRTISEGGIEKNLDADTVKNWSVLEDVQGINGWQEISENDSKEVQKSAFSPLEALQGEELPRPPKINSGYSKLKRHESCKSQLALESYENTQWSTTSSNTTTNDMPSVCATASNATLQKPPGFLFPESRDVLYAPPAVPPSLPSFSPSSTSSVLSPSPFYDCLSSPDLDILEKSTAEVNTASVSMVSIETSQVPVPPLPPLPSYDEVQSMTRATPLLNGMNASQMHIQHPTVEKASNRDLEAVPLHVKDLAETMKADYKMQPQRPEFLDAQILPRKNGDSHGGSQGATHAFSALPSRTKANVGLDVPDPTTKIVSGSLSADGCNLPGYAPYFGLENVVCPVPDAAHQPGVYIDSSESYLSATSAATGRLVKEGGNWLAEGSPTLYLPMRTPPIVSYYNPFYSMLPANVEFQDGRVNSSGHCCRDQISHFVGSGPEESLYNPTTAAVMNAGFASFSAEGGKKESPKDLLRSDLADHLQNLQFGRWCQEQFSQPYLESASLYHTSQLPVLWGVAPFTPLPGIMLPFNHEFSNVQGPLPAPLSMPHNLPWPCTAETLSKQKTGAETLLPSSNVMYRDMESLTPQIATQFNEWSSGGKQGDTNTWGMTCISTVSHPSTIHASVSESSHYGDCKGAAGVNGLSSPINAQGVRSSHLPDQFSGRVVPLVARQLEFGSLGPIEIISFPDAEVGSRQFNRYGTGDASANRFSSLLVKDVNQTPPNTQR